VKCRFCGEFLNTGKAKALEAGLAPSSPLYRTVPGDEKTDEKVLFKARPSLWGMAGAVIKGAIFLGAAAFLIAYPLENLSIFQRGETEDLAAYNELMEKAAESELVEGTAPEVSGSGLTEEQALFFAYYRKAAGIGLICLVVLILLMKVIKLKMTYYEVTSDRIEWSRGILDRRVDNLDMFRVIDLKLRRSLLDCIFGIGTVGLITTDKTDPEFTFEKIRNCRRLYDVIKKASLDADRRTGVVHLE
jgi:membrane protein YdbS with pleckstrin-like domain